MNSDATALFPLDLELGDGAERALLPLFDLDDLDLLLRLFEDFDFRCLGLASDECTTSCCSCLFCCCLGRDLLLLRLPSLSRAPRDLLRLRLLLRDCSLLGSASPFFFVPRVAEEDSVGVASADDLIERPDLDRPPLLGDRLGGGGGVRMEEEALPDFDDLFLSVMIRMKWMISMDHNCGGLVCRLRTRGRSGFCFLVGKGGAPSI